MADDAKELAVVRAANAYLIAERDEARAEVERLRAELHLGQDEAKRLRAAVQAVRDMASDEGRWMYGKPMVENHFGPDFLDGYGYAMRDVLAALDGERDE